MNSISLNPTTAAYNNVKLNNYMKSPTFTGKIKKPTSGQVEQTSKIIKKTYNLFFVPFGEKVMTISNGKVSTISKGVEKDTQILKSYPLWSRTPQRIAINSPKKNYRELFDLTKKEGYNYKFRDMTQPEYDVSAEYQNINFENWHDYIYKGDIKLNYAGKSVTINNEKRGELLKKLSKSLDEKYDDRLNAFMRKDVERKETIQELSKDFFSDPDQIAHAILASPSSLKRQVDTVSSCMPYGIEKIMSML